MQTSVTQKVKLLNSLPINFFLFSWIIGSSFCSSVMSFYIPSYHCTAFYVFLLWFRVFFTFLCSSLGLRATTFYFLCVSLETWDFPMDFVEISWFFLNGVDLGLEIWASAFGFCKINSDHFFCGFWCILVTHRPSLLSWSERWMDLRGKRHHVWR